MPQITRKFYMSAQDKVNMATDIRKQTISQLIDAYSSSATYELGDFCNKDGVIYKCTTAITTAEAWNADHWAVAKLNEVIDAINEAVASVNGKANVDGNYPTMSVGLADNLTSPDGVVDTEPFVFRPTAGTVSVSDGYDEVRNIRGNTVVKNQICSNSADNSTKNGITSTNNGDGSWTINGTATADTIIGLSSSQHLQKGKYLLRGCPAGGALETYHLVDGWSYALNTDFGEGTITELNNKTKVGLAFTIRSGITLNNLVIKPRLYNLTQMFGAGNEPTTIEEFNALTRGIDTDTYNEGTVLGVDIYALETTGINQFDEELELGAINGQGQPVESGGNIRTKNFIPVVCGKTYTLTWINADTSAGGKSINIYEYDKNKQFIKRNESYEYFTTPKETTLTDKTCFVKIVWWKDGITTSVPTDAQIAFHLTHSGYRNGQYEPHWKETREIDVKTYFPNGMHGMNGVYDELTPKKAIQRFDMVDLGTLDFSRVQTANGYCFYGGLPTSKLAGVNEVANLRCSKYIPDTYAHVYENVADKIIARQSDGQNIVINDTTYTDVATFKQSLQGVILYYELATPVETEIEQTKAINWNYRISDFGTEEFLTESETAPVGHETFYMRNLRDSIRNLDSVIEIENNSTKIKTKEGYGYIEIGENGISLFNGIDIYMHINDETIKLESRTFENYNFDLVEFLTPTIVPENWVNGQTFANRQVIENYIQTHNRIIDSVYGELFIFKYSETQILLRSQRDIAGVYKFYNFSGSTDSSWSLTISEE